MIGGELGSARTDYVINVIARGYADFRRLSSFFLVCLKVEFHQLGDNARLVVKEFLETVRQSYVEIVRVVRRA